MDCARERTLFVFVGLAHVEHDRPVGNVRSGTLGVDLSDLGLRGGEQVTERCHGNKAYRVGQDYNAALPVTVLA